jgi:hypothetical protein
MQTTDVEKVAERLSRGSRKLVYDVYARFSWPEGLDASVWAMSPEYVSLYGTPLWHGMSEDERRKLAFFECAGFFSMILHGERPLLEGMSHRLYTLEKNLTVTEYMHHFLDEENKHMIMFSSFLRRYFGKVYPEKKVAFARTLAPGEEDIAFFAKVLVVEELSDVYNVAMATDERLAPIVREINHTHHVDEARHIHFGRTYLKQLWDRSAAAWREEQRESFRAWLVEYINASWRDFYQPAVYRDAGLHDPYGARDVALASPVCRAHRQRCSEKYLNNLVSCGILRELPQLQ